MQLLDISTLAVGQKFPLPLFHSSGRKLLGANTPLTTQHISVLLRCGITQVYCAKDAAAVLHGEDGQPGTATQALPAGAILVKKLNLGAIAENDLMTPNGTIIVWAGEQIEDHHLTALHDSQIDYIIPRPAQATAEIRQTTHELARMVLDRLDAMIRAGEHLRVTRLITETKPPDKTIPNDPYKPYTSSSQHHPDPIPMEKPSRPQKQHPDKQPLLTSLRSAQPTKNRSKKEVFNLAAVQEKYQQITTRLRIIYSRLETGGTPKLSVMESIVTDMINFMKEEPRQFPQLALMTTRQDDYLPGHALSVAVLAMAVATQMSLSEEEVRIATMAALLADVGMLLIPKSIRKSFNRLSKMDYQRIRTHPIYSTTMLEQITDISPEIQIAAYQHHERLNGSGYPCKIADEYIGDYARIITVADIFAAMAGPRAYKHNKLPYHAMEEIVHMAHKGILDIDVVKALLASVGLFPVGSCALLSNAMRVRVVGSNTNRIDRPLVCPIEPDGSFGAMMDLSHPSLADVKICKPITPPMRNTLLGA